MDQGSELVSPAILATACGNYSGSGICATACGTNIIGGLIGWPGAKPTVHRRVGCRVPGTGDPSRASRQAAGRSHHRQRFANLDARHVGRNRLEGAAMLRGGLRLDVLLRTVGELGRNRQAPRRPWPAPLPPRLTIRPPTSAMRGRRSGRPARSRRGSSCTRASRRRSSGALVLDRAGGLQQNRALGRLHAIDSLRPLGLDQRLVIVFGRAAEKRKRHAALARERTVALDAVAAEAGDHRHHVAGKENRIGGVRRLRLRRAWRFSAGGRFAGPQGKA